MVDTAGAAKTRDYLVFVLVFNCTSCLILADEASLIASSASSNFNWQRLQVTAIVGRRLVESVLSPPSESVEYHSLAGYGRSVSQLQTYFFFFLPLCLALYFVC
uniref:Putative secreted protein n=1 Tax=Ixodes ricinus TaxID=34613 RepID=A0A6B0UFR2_IXORI